MPATNPPENHRRLGDFEILRELGRGGMGVVFEARQVSLNRKVALKVLSAGLGLTKNAVPRFHREAEAAAKLHHTNIVPIYTTGEADGTHFYAMELIDGPSLDHVIKDMREAFDGTARKSVAAQGQTPSTQDERRSASADFGATGPYMAKASPSVDAAAPTSSVSSSSLQSGGQYFDTVARMIADVADALEHAHQSGVIHRDVKPSNMLLSTAGRLSINDFGLARMLEQPGMTMTGEFVGSPAYMSPEQITAGRAPLNHRTDIYSLGATLYELLTLERPFTGERRDEVIAQIMHKEPKAPRKLNPQVPVDLETICLKCMEKDPDRRYQTAGGLAADLRCYVNRFAISARRAGPVQRAVKWVKRHPAVAASLACVAVAVCIALGFAYMERRARQELLALKIRNAYVTATTGDSKLTEEAIDEIEQLDGSAGQVRILRGMAAYFGGNGDKAVEELEKAVKLLPESVAAHALLFYAYDDVGLPNIQTASTMEKLTPTSDEDYLFRGYARELFNGSGLGLEDVEKGLARNKSVLGLALRAFSYSNRATATGKLDEANKALADAKAAKVFQPDNPLVLAASLYANTVAANVFKEHIKKDEYNAALADARKDVNSLEPHVGLPVVDINVWAFHEAHMKEGALEAMKKAYEKSKHRTAASLYAYELYDNEMFLQAKNIIDSYEGHNLLRMNLLLALVTAESPSPDAYQKALEIYEKRIAGNPALSSGPIVPLVLGRPDLACAYYKLNLTDFFGVKTDSAKRFSGDVRRFGAGELAETPDEAEKILIEAAGADRHRLDYAHYIIGMFRLANGKRDGAIESFKAAANLNCYWISSSFWSRTFLRRLEKDRDRLRQDPKGPPPWPRWKAS